MGCSSLPVMPRNMKQIAPNEQFAFSCHSGVSCFTECCRMLELALSPYDVLRLRGTLGLLSSEVLERYIIEEFESDDIFPRYYLTMVDDGRASCVFVTQDGCSVYNDRPGACRTYPLGRAARISPEGIEEQFVLIKEEHCQGFGEEQSQSVVEYCKDQGVQAYNDFSDKLAKLTMHPKVQGGFRPSKEQRDLFHLALYDLDNFRAKIVRGDVFLTEKAQGQNPANLSDEELLDFGIDWLIERFFD